MAASSTIQITAKFTDETKKTVSIGEMSPTSVSEQKIRNQITLLNNAEQREQEYPGFTNGFVSQNGAPFDSIIGAKIVTSSRTVIF